MNQSIPLVLGPAELATRLASGSAAIFPTDTLPALAAAPAQAQQLWQLKRRPADKPLILMGADPEQLLAALEMPVFPEWRAMAAQGWPGALTLVLPAQGEWAEALHCGGGTLGLRVPDCPSALELLRLSGPLATTSANISAALPCLTPHEAAEQFPTLPLLGPLPWPEPSGAASTVLAWKPQGGWQILRRGALMPSNL